MLYFNKGFDGSFSLKRVPLGTIKQRVSSNIGRTNLKSVLWGVVFPICCIREGVNCMDMDQLREMKRQMATRGNWKEVKRINKMIEFHGLM